jgi:hypothetical protein
MKKVNINSWDFAYWLGVVAGWISMAIACTILCSCVPTSKYVVSVKKYRDKQFVYYPDTMDSVQTAIQKHYNFDMSYITFDGKGCFQYENDTVFIYVEKRNNE